MSKTAIGWCFFLLVEYTALGFYMGYSWSQKRSAKPAQASECRCVQKDAA